MPSCTPRCSACWGCRSSFIVSKAWPIIRWIAGTKLFSRSTILARHFNACCSVVHCFSIVSSCPWSRNKCPRSLEGHAAPLTFASVPLVRQPPTRHASNRFKFLSQIFELCFEVSSPHALGTARPGNFFGNPPILTQIDQLITVIILYYIVNLHDTRRHVWHDVSCC